MGGIDERNSDRCALKIDLRLAVIVESALLFRSAVQAIDFSAPLARAWLRSPRLHSRRAVGAVIPVLLFEWYRVRVFTV